jgi:hypothetical protein
MVLQERPINAGSAPTDDVTAERPAPEATWDMVLRQGCQLIADAGGQVTALRIEARSGTVDHNVRLVDCLTQARGVAAEYGLRATVGYQKGHVSVTLRSR